MNTTLAEEKKDFDLTMKNCIKEFVTTPKVEINICANNEGFFDYKTVNVCISNNDKLLFEKAKGVFKVSESATKNYTKFADFSVNYIEKFDDYFIMLIALGLLSLLFKYSKKDQSKLLNENLEKSN